MAPPQTQRGRSRIYTNVRSYWTWQRLGGQLRGGFGASFPGWCESKTLTTRHCSDMLADLTIAGDFTVPADSPPSNKRERDESDNESTQQPSTPSNQTDHPRRSTSVGSPAYPAVRMAQASDTLPLRASAQPGAEFTSVHNAVPVPLPPNVATTVLKREMQPHVFGHLAPPTPPSKPSSVVIPQPYSGNFVPLGGSSGLGMATAALQSSAPGSKPTVASFRSSASPLSASGTSGFSVAPTMYSSNKGMRPLSAGAGGAPSSPGINHVMLAKNGLYNLSAPTPPSASSSASSPSPHNGFQPSHDFGTGAGGGMFDMQGMNMEYSGYDVPVAEKEAMLRNFAPGMLQDGQIGVDRDTMMMWSTMPSTLECVSIYGPSAMRLIPDHKGRKIGNCTCRACWVWVLLMTVVQALALAWM